MKITILKSGDRPLTIESAKGTHVFETGLYTRKAADLIEGLITNTYDLEKLHFGQQNYDFRAPSAQGVRKNTTFVFPIPKYVFLDINGQVCLTMSNFFNSELVTEIDCRNKMMRLLSICKMNPVVDKTNFEELKRLYCAMGFDYYDFFSGLNMSMTAYHELKDLDVKDLVGEPIHNPLFQEALLHYHNRLYEIDQQLFKFSDSQFCDIVKESSEIYDQMIGLLE